MPTKINTAVMPGDNMTPDTIDAAARSMSTVGTEVSSQGGTVLTTWQKISASYHAPEEDTLFHAMNPVKTEAESFGTDVATVSTALTTFAAEVRIIKAAVAAIKAEAATFLSGIEDGVEKKHAGRTGAVTTETIEWHEDQASVNANNDLIRRTNDQQEALWAAERKCANAIYDVIGHKHIEAANAANCQQGYGVDQIPDNADMPWGQTVAKTENCGETVVHGVANGVGAMVSGVAGLTGWKYTGTGLWDHWDWSWEHSGATAGEAWKGLGMFAVGVATFGPVGLALTTIPGPVGTFFKDSLLTVPAFVGSLGAIDIYSDDPLHKWKASPGQAIGESVFNIATLFAAPAKLGTAGKLGRAGEVAAKVTDPAYLAIQASRAVKTLAGPTLESLARLNKAIDLDGMTKIDTPEIDIPSVRREDVSTDTPNVGNQDRSDSPNVGNHDRSDSNDGTDAPPPRDYVDDQGGRDAGPNDGGANADSGSGQRDSADTPETAGKDPVNDGSTNNQPGSTTTQPDLPKGIERQTWEPQAGSEPVSTANLQRVDDTHPPVEFTTSNSNQLGKYGEELTKQALIREGWDVVLSGRHIRMPGGQPGSYFVPDFIARDPSGRVIAVEAKMGPGAHFTPGQLDGYEKLAQGQPLEARSAKMQKALDDLDITSVDGVQVFRWNTELVPDQALINAAGLAGKVKP
jgi:hypothetical protein